MNMQLVEIQPREVKFLFEVKKQSSCAVHLANITDQYVAFKVKTTSPKKYCVRPNVGIIKPNSTCDFTVTMQAQKSAPIEMLCKDKFLIQSTVVPFGTTEDEITAGMFAKNSEKYIEETKLRVSLISPLNSPVKTQAPDFFKQDTEAFKLKESSLPVLISANGAVKQKPLNETLLPQGPVVLKQETSYEIVTPKVPHSPVLRPVNGVAKQEPSYQTSISYGHVALKQEGSYENFTPKEPVSPVLLPVDGAVEREPSYKNSVLENKLQRGVENISLPDTLMKKEEELRNVREIEKSISMEVMDQSLPFRAKSEKAKQVKEMEDVKMKLVQDIEELKKKISGMDVKLVEAEHTIVKLEEEKNSTTRDMEMLKQELAMVRSQGGARKIRYVGFPPLFVCMVAMISMVVGFLFRS